MRTRFPSALAVGLGLALVVGGPAMGQQVRLRALQGQESPQAQEEYRKAQEAWREAMREWQKLQAQGRVPGQFNFDLDINVPEAQELLGQVFPAETLDHGLGLMLKPVDDLMRSHLDLPEDRGLVVVEVAEDSRAAQAGLRKNDILLEVTGGDLDLALSDVNDLAGVLEGAGNQPLTFTLIRKGETTTVEVPAVEDDVDETRKQYFIGVALQPIDESLQAQLGLDEGQGLAVQQVVEGSPAESVGLEVGDILLSLNDTPINNPEALVEQVQEVGSEPATLKYLRKGETQTVEITPAEREVPVAEVRPDRTRPRGFRFPGPGIMVDPRGRRLEIPPDQMRRFQPVVPREFPEGRFSPEMQRSHEELRKQLEELRKELESLRESQRKRDET